MHFAFAHGLSLASEWELPSGVLSWGGDSPPHVRFRSGIVSRPEGVDDREGWYAFGRDAHRFHWPLLGTVRIEGGADVVVEARADAPRGLVQHVLLGPVMADILLSRGHLPLHASCVRVSGGVIAIVGPPGAGKSTLAACLAVRGAVPHGDDLIAVDPATGQVPFGTTRTKLNRDVLAALAVDDSGAPTIYEGVDKRSVVLPGEVPDPTVCLPLRAVYRLADAGDLAVKPAPAALTPLGLMKDVFRVEVEQHALGAQTLLDRCSAVARHVPLFLLRRPRDLSRLPAVADAVLAHAASISAAGG